MSCSAAAAVSIASPHAGVLPRLLEMAVEQAPNSRHATGFLAVAYQPQREAKGGDISAIGSVLHSRVKPRAQRRRPGAGGTPGALTWPAVDMPTHSAYRWNSQQDVTGSFPTAGRCICGVLGQDAPNPSLGARCPLTQ
jgi:hypothetical protein